MSLVLPAYNEAEHIRAIVDEFLKHPSVDEVLVVDNNSKDKTAEEIKKTHAQYMFEPMQGYGSALQRGMREAKGDIIITLDADGTYFASDIEKFLIYSDSFDFVFGARTSRSLILPGAFMPWQVRTGNWLVAKALVFLFGGFTLTEVGCTFKLIKRSAYEKIKNAFTVQGSHFSPEFLIRIIQHGISGVEIPIFYRPRAGQSKGATGDLWSSMKIGFRMVRFILRERLLAGKNAKHIVVAHKNP